MLVTDGRYRTQAGEQVTGAGLAEAVDVVVGGAEAQRDAVRRMLTDAGVRRLGLESDHVTWSSQRRWAHDLGSVELVPTTAVVEALRQVKDGGELACMARAADIADEALGSVLALLATRPREADFALELDSAMRRLGAEDRAFETIIASGPNAAMPHARPSGRVIERGDPVVIDFGATFEDIART